ncbi:Anaphase-promoting complex subunit 8 [Microbotryomycetes sp. JL221]|nr:Anaphase-promoting complex subunit 8 [Microbotryomycetes sp. JL221]
MQQTQTASPLSPLEVDVVQIRKDLRNAVRECMDRGLNASARWCAQLQSTLVKPTHHSEAQHEASTSRSTAGPSTFRTSTPVKADQSAGANRAGSTATGRASLLPGLPPMTTSFTSHGHGRDSLGSILEMGSSPAHPHVLEDEDHHLDEDMVDDDEATAAHRTYKALDDEEETEYMLALSYLRMHEYLRCGHALRDCRGPKARWLRTYAKYMAGEKRAQEEDGQLLGTKDKHRPNSFAVELLHEMESWPEPQWYSDGWWMYLQVVPELKALLLLSMPPNATPPASLEVMHADVRVAAMDLLIKSVGIEPWNWSAWLRLASCVEGPDELDTVIKHLEDGVPFRLFFVHATLEIHAAGDNLHEVVVELEQTFPGSSMLQGLRALIHYHVREFDEAQEYFIAMQNSDPYRIEEIDIYSNILYVSEERAKLAALAQEYVKVDRSRPEVCCLIGNYYSLRREHEKAIVYFRRALKLDRSYLSAWTLMGHEYVEIKNTNAAIASYRRAVDVNRKDYRAWYGLGQTYELLGEPFYALTYYQQATALRPFDTRMWTALAICYEKLKRVPDAIKAYQRALVSSDVGEGDTALRIGRLYSLLGDSFKAAQYHRRALYEGLKTEAPKNQLSKLYVWLARHEIDKEKRGEDADLRLAEDYLDEAKTVQEDKEEAETLLKELNLLVLNRD